MNAFPAISRRPAFVLPVECFQCEAAAGIIWLALQQWLKPLLDGHSSLLNWQHVDLSASCLNESSDAANDHTQSRKSLYKNILLLITGSMREKKHLFMFLLSKTDQLFTHWATLFISVASLIDTRWVSRLRQKNLPILTYLMPHQTPQWLMSPERRWKHNFVCVCNKTVTCGNQKKLSATLLFFSLLLIIFIASSLTSSRLLLEF